ncbi:FdhF/YdeP family oxidoreductase [Aporhodopirellula aestuarii]|uniref:FdhF/YdeP family oxidoreductase n=1 Tax=Aporhodopirellula aestuarii TaxID=2950107 RepID=A0ABT0U996_9BACT|nr:FdhF/YdeP family oxidoreductase [Aporhodopirellula aestuarii]MCM2373475.1 FdhF/YdeP family oxidoreductase [Aporhodopirellula aestuarii]
MTVRSGGGFRAIFYSLKKGREAGGYWKFFKAMRSRNTCKTCALGMGGQKGGMVNEKGSFPEVCKKSMQAMVSDMQPGIEPTFWKNTSIEQLQKLSPRELEYLGRLLHPIRYRAGATHFETITWEEAFDSIVAKLNSLSPDETFWYFSGRSSNEAGFVLQLLARVYGTNNVNNCSFYCHQASGVGLQTSVGSGTATIDLNDLEKADLVFLIGGNPASNHPRLMSSLVHVRRHGGKIIVINPAKETGLVNFRIPSDPISLLKGSKIASHYTMPHIGGDLALLWGIAKVLRDRDQIKIDFLKKHCRGEEDFLSRIDELSWEEIESKSGVARDEIETLAEMYAASERTVFAWTMGITHHAHGVENVQAIANLAMCRGMVGRPGAGLMPIRGHSNVQGIGSVGVTPKLKQQIFDSLQTKFNVILPTTPGLDTLSCMEAAAEGSVKAAFCLGGNLYGSNPDANFANRALSNLDMNVMMSTTMNTGHVHGLADETIILPVLARDEEPESTTQESMFNYVRLSDGGPRRLPGPRSEVQVIATLGQRLLPNAEGIDWDQMQHTETIRQWIGGVVPGYEKIQAIGTTKEEFHIGGRIYHEPSFGTEDGRAVMHAHTLPPLKGTSDDELRLMTVRSEGQFNTVVYEEEDVYRNQERRDIILMHPDDLTRLCLTHDQRVRVENETGHMDSILARGYENIRPGNALMYYPECNVLVARYADPQSKTPAFKGVVVKVKAMPTN